MLAINLSKESGSKDLSRLLICFQYQSICVISTKKIAMNIYLLDGLSSSYIAFVLLQMLVRQPLLPDHRY